MNDAVAQEGEAKKRGRTKKEDAPFEVVYVNDKGEVEARVPAIPSVIRVKAKTGETADISMADFSAQTKEQLIAFALAAKVSAEIRKAENPIAAVGDFVKRLADGQFYTKKGEGKPGRQFPYEMWVEALRRTLELSVKSEEKKHAKDKSYTPKIVADNIPMQLDHLRDKLMSVTGKDRKAITDKLKTSSVFVANLKAVELEKAKKEAKLPDDLEFMNF